MGASKRFSYYGRLSAADQRVYRKSDAVTAVELRGSGALSPDVEALRGALLSGRRSDVERRARVLCRGITARLAVPPVVVRVRSVRPADRGGELHGLYTWESGKSPLIEVWMRTARNRDVVQFRTFLRTLIHEVCHHLDFTLLELPETFHTEGFFRRESSLVRQLLGAARPRRAHAPAPDSWGAPRRPPRLASRPLPLRRASETGATRPPRGTESQLKLFE